MVASDRFAEFLRDQLAPLGRIAMRRMFGKTGSTTTTARPSRKPNPFRLSTIRRRAAPSIFRSGALRSACSTSPMTLSFGRGPRSPRRGGLRRRENVRRESENQSLNCEAGMRAEADPSARPLGRFCRRMRLASLVRAFALRDFGFPSVDLVGEISRQVLTVSGQTSRSRAPSLRHTPE
jgi:hypothetical protein